MVLYCIHFFCTVSHYHVPLLQRAGELPRSASSHFNNIIILKYLLEPAEYLKGAFTSGFLLLIKIASNQNRIYLPGVPPTGVHTALLCEIRVVWSPLQEQHSECSALYLKINIFLFKKEMHFIIVRRTQNADDIIQRTPSLWQVRNYSLLLLPRGKTIFVLFSGRFTVCDSFEVSPFEETHSLSFYNLLWYFCFRFRKRRDSPDDNNNTNDRWAPAKFFNLGLNYTSTHHPLT